MTTHELKTWPAYYAAVVSGHKTFEARKNDRGFCVGDFLLLKEFDPLTRVFSGNSVLVRVTYILDSPQFVAPGIVIMAFRRLTDEDKMMAPS